MIEAVEPRRFLAADAGVGPPVVPDGYELSQPGDTWAGHASPRPTAEQFAAVGELTPRADDEGPMGLEVSLMRRRFLVLGWTHVAEVDGGYVWQTDAGHVFAEARPIGQAERGDGDWPYDPRLLRFYLTIDDGAHFGHTFLPEHLDALAADKTPVWGLKSAYGNPDTYPLAEPEPAVEPEPVVRLAPDVGSRPVGGAVGVSLFADEPLDDEREGLSPAA